MNKNERIIEITYQSIIDAIDSAIMHINLGFKDIALIELDAARNCADVQKQYSLNINKNLEDLIKNENKN